MRPTNCWRYRQTEHRFYAKIVTTITTRNSERRKSLKIPKGNQNPHIDEEQTTQWPKEKIRKDKQRSTKHTLYSISLKMGDIDLLNVNVTHFKADNIFVWTWLHKVVVLCAKPNALTNTSWSVCLLIFCVAINKLHS